MKFYTTSQISENMHETPEGYLVCVGVAIARTGEMVYGDGETPLEVGEDGRVVVSRDEKEVFRPETIASFEGKSVTISHPEDFVSPENWARLSKGILQNVRRGEGQQNSDLVADLLITDKLAIGLVKNGLREVSCGYEAEYTQVGVGRGVQTSIVGNHLALVEQGRAGSSYAINDHAPQGDKGKGLTMKLVESIKSIFGEAQDKALKLVEETKDENTTTPVVSSGFVTMKDVAGYCDERFGEKKEEKKADDASTPPTQSEPAKIVAKDDEMSEEDKKKASRDAWIDAQMEKESKEKADDESEEEESEDDDFEESNMVGDAALASRVEILAPGMKAVGKDIKAKALLKAYETKDGKAVIDQFTGGKAPNVKNEDIVDALFVGASELLKEKRTTEVSKTKTFDFTSNMGQPQGFMTPEEMNKRNAEYYKR